jgi:peptidyl-prolyl cis-trans isomerase C
MRTVYKLILIALLAAGIAACNKQGANKDDDQVLATVNGTPITNSTYRAFLREQANGQEPELNPIQKASLVKQLVKLEIVAQAARKAGMDKTPDTQAELQLTGNDIMAQALLQDYAKKHQPSEADIKAAYDQKVKAMDTHQYKARHILVTDQAQAKDIIAKLGKGANFATLAKTYSLDKQSAKDGGELGDWFSTDKMVPEFGAALKMLKKGEITPQPVQTQYGWHVIQLEDVRETVAPSLEQMHDELANQMQSKLIQDYMKQLTDAAKVDMKTPDPTAPIALPAPAAASATKP